MNATEKLELQVAEEADGSAIVTMPDEPGDEGNAPAVDNQPQQKANADGQDHDDDDDHDDLPAPNRGEVTDDDREAIRERRRQERQNKKQVQRQRMQESQVLINALRKQNEDLATRLAAVEKRTSGAEIARVNKAIEDAQLRQEYAKSKIQEALEARDGQAMVKAQEMLFESRKQMDQLSGIKNAIVKQASSPASNIKLPNQEVQVLATNWMKKNNWYDPNLKSTDSKIARNVDEELTTEGWDPATPEYWDELDNRLQKYLPHRYERVYNSPDDNDSPSSSTPKRRSMITGNSRENSSAGSARPGEFRLSPDRVNAMKEAGIWNDPVKRAKMIKQYAAYDRAARKG